MPRPYRERVTSELSTILLGTGTTLALITAIGAQNAFVLRQALLGRFILPVIIFCILADTMLYSLGVAGMGFLVERSPWVITALKWGGVVFLVGYGLMALRRAAFSTGKALVVTESDALGPDAALPAPSPAASDAGFGSGGVPTGTLTAVRPEVHVAAAEAVPVPGRPRRVDPGLVKALLTCAAMTFLNPHTYLDTVVLVGSVANQQGPDGRWWFFIGAALGSTIWFILLGYGARLLRPLFARPVTWRFLDLGIALLMFSIAWHLI